MNNPNAAELLARAGAALHGAQWVAPLARELGVHRVTVHHWATGRYPVPTRAWRDLVLLVDARRKETWRVGDMIRDQISGI